MGVGTVALGDGGTGDGGTGLGILFSLIAGTLESSLCRGVTSGFPQGSETN